MTLARRRVFIAHLLATAQHRANPRCRVEQRARLLGRELRLFLRRCAAHRVDEVPHRVARLARLASPDRRQGLLEFIPQSTIQRPAAAKSLRKRSRFPICSAAPATCTGKPPVARFPWGSAASQFTVVNCPAGLIGKVLPEGGTQAGVTAPAQTSVAEVEMVAGRAAGDGVPEGPGPGTSTRPDSDRAARRTLR